MVKQPYLTIDSLMLAIAIFGVCSIVGGLATYFSGNTNINRLAYDLTQNTFISASTQDRIAAESKRSLQRQILWFYGGLALGLAAACVVLLTGWTLHIPV